MTNLPACDELIEPRPCTYYVVDNITSNTVTAAIPTGIPACKEDMQALFRRIRMALSILN